MSVSTQDGLVIRAGGAAGDGFDLVVTPESAGWGYSSLRVLTLAPDVTRTLATGSDEVIVLPLAGSVTVEVPDGPFELAGRPNVFAGPTDCLYLGRDTGYSLRSRAGGRFALAGARTEARLPNRYLAASSVPVELRGAGPASRQVRNFGTPDTLTAGKIIACEVLTPSGNWSSYPAHKHDEATDTEAVLEEIYYYEIAAGPDGQPGFGYHQTTSSAAGKIEVLTEVGDRDTVLVPYGWHGPCVAAPGFDMYYLNVMSGPGGERAWLISDHPAQAFVRSTWADQPVDPRLLPEET